MRFAPRTEGGPGGYPSKASGGMGNSSNSTFDEMLHEAEIRCARATWSAIQDLPADERVAVEHVHCSDRYADSEAPPIEAYTRALPAIRAGLIRRGIV